MLHDGIGSWRQRTTAWLCLVIVIAVVASCARRMSRTGDDEIVIVMDNVAQNFDPRYTANNNDGKLSKLIAPGLVAADTPDQRPRMELAESVTPLDPLTWQAVLRPNLHFSDGVAVTADDVVWTYTSVLQKGSDSPFAKNLAERFSSVEAVDARTVRFHLIAPLGTFLSDIDFGIVAKHGAAADGHFSGGTPIGAGPYRLLEHDLERVELVANPTYWNGAPKIPHLTVKFVSDPAARALMLAGGSADLVLNGVRLDLLDDVAERPRVVVATAPSLLLTYLMFNNEDPVLKDVRVRHAIAMALDRQAIVDGKFGGRAVLAAGLLAPTHWAFHEDIPRTNFDRARAMALLDEAGIVDPDGAGPKPRLSLTYKTSSDAFRVSVARVIAEQLGDIGIAVEVLPFEFATFVADVKKGRFQLASMQTTDITEPDFYFAYFHSSRIPTEKNRDPLNRWRYRNADVDAWTEAGRRETDLDKRKIIYAKVQDQIANDVPIVPLWHEASVVVTNRRVHGFVMSPNARLGGLVAVTKSDNAE
jgi:peptide/nickel transport system substrate-binding protein